jgi:hypothetical protein
MLNSGKKIRALHDKKKIKNSNLCCPKKKFNTFFSEAPMIDI